VFAFGRRPNATVETTFAWYEEQRAGLGREFLHELDVVYERIAKFAFLYAELYRGLRRARLRRFPVGVFTSSRRPRFVSSR
jgi:hypothetical protein